MTSIEFGYLPEPRDYTVGDITVATLPGLDEKRREIEESGLVEKKWIYGPPAAEHDILRGVRDLPFPSRVFGLAKTHSLSHATSTDPAHLSFLVWMLGFIEGIRLTDTEAGFLDATPIKTGALHDIVWLKHSERRALGLADAFWKQRGSKASKWLAGVVHALFLSHNPRLLNFEEFMFVYTAIEGCNAVWKATQNPPPPYLGHGKRIANLCTQLKTVTPSWIQTVVDSRNDTFHEALFFDEPLGFALFGGPAHGQQPRNIIMQMQHLVSRFVCALLELPCPTYIASPVDSRGREGVTLPP
jgi:hypothetical protein